MSEWETDKWRIKYMEHAERDLDAIFTYIAETLLVPDAARSQVRRILDAADKLDDMPMRHPFYKDEPWRSMGLRSLQVDNYLVFYKPDELRHVVFIIRVLYGGRDISEELKETVID
jgi:toxin ParE1/3/4